MLWGGGPGEKGGEGVAPPSTFRPGLFLLGPLGGALGAPIGSIFDECIAKVAWRPSAFFPLGAPGLDELGLGTGSLGARNWQPRGPDGA